MRSDIDKLMQARDFDAILVAGGEEYSVVRDYMTKGAEITKGIIIKTPGTDPLLIVSGMETEEAAKSGYPFMTYGAVGYYDIIDQYDDQSQREVALWQACLRQAGVTSGRIGIYGTGAINETMALMPYLDDTPYEFVGEANKTLFDEAFMTKDADEIARLKSVAERTNAVLQATWDYIAGHHAQADTVVKADGTPLTVGDVKQFVRRALLERGLEDTNMIFAPGRSAGHPHSRGEANDALKLGQSIVFDLFPREMGGGYHHDVTRTWCIGHAPDAVQNAYEQVMQALDIAVESFSVGKPTHLMQTAVQDYFEANGHATLRTERDIKQGYVHGLGHGIGLLVHEPPVLHHYNRDDVFAIGNCLTIEPGLYYPDDGYGVRIEDTYVVTENGELISITPFKKDLVLPLNR